MPHTPATTRTLGCDRRYRNSHAHESTCRTCTLHFMITHPTSPKTPLQVNNTTIANRGSSPGDLLSHYCSSPAATSPPAAVAYGLLYNTNTSQHSCFQLITSTWCARSTRPSFSHHSGRKAVHLQIHCATYRPCAGPKGRPPSPGSFHRGRVTCANTEFAWHQLTCSASSSLASSSQSLHMMINGTACSITG